MLVSPRPALPTAEPAPGGAMGAMARAGRPGISPEKGLPTEWSRTKNVKWKTAVGAGHSSADVWGDRIF